MEFASGRIITDDPAALVAVTGASSQSRRPISARVAGSEVVDEHP